MQKCYDPPHWHHYNCLPCHAMHSLICFLYQHLKLSEIVWHAGKMTDFERTSPLCSMSVGYRGCFATELIINGVYVQVLKRDIELLNSQELVEDFKNLLSAAVQAHPDLQDAVAPEQSMTETETFPSDVEEEANSYFQRIYVGAIQIEEVVEMLKRFSQASSTARYNYIA